MVIPAGKHLLLDESTPKLGALTIDGKLTFARKNVHLQAQNIAVHGTLEVGTEANPFLQKAIITLTDTNSANSHMGMGTRGIMVMHGGKLELHGYTPETLWTKIDAHAPDQSTSLVLEKQVNWKAGDEIVVGPTDFFEAANKKSVTQKITALSVSNKTVNLSKPLNAFHWGRLQYVTDQGISLTPDSLAPMPDFQSIYGVEKTEPPKIIDERAPIGNLTRNIVIEAPDDDVWKNEGFGAHVMIMRSSYAYVSGVEIKRGGQKGRLGRYPFHWHMLSYDGSTLLQDATGQYFKNSTVNESANRGIVVHGTNGVTVENNIVYNVLGHAVFTEDAAERRNVFKGNLVLHVRNPEAQFALKKHELAANGRGSSGFWLSNPDNTVIDNHVGDIHGIGYWLAFPSKLFGESRDALSTIDNLPMNPRRMMFGTFKNNTAHSCAGAGLHNDHPETDDAGNTGDSGLKDYRADVTEREVVWPRDTWRRFDIDGLKTFKNRSSIWERATYVNVKNNESADHSDQHFAGSGDNGLIINSLAVGRSLNHAQNPAVENNMAVPSAFASYHHTYSIMGTKIVNFSANPLKLSGAFSTVDYYLRPVEKGHWLTRGVVLVNSHAGVKLTPSQANAEHIVSSTAPHFSLAGAIWDPQGFWGPKNNYYVYDKPFYTYGSAVSEVAPSAAVSGGVSVKGPFYGINSLTISAENGSSENRTGMLFSRYDDNLNPVDSVRLYETNSVFLQVMKSVALQKGGIYTVTYPDLNKPFSINYNNITNLLSADDEVVVGFEFSGDINAKVTINRPFNAILIHTYAKVNSFNEVKNSTTEAFWQDKVNELVWVKLKGGRVNNQLDDIFWENYVYQPFLLRIVKE